MNQTINQLSNYIYTNTDVQEEHLLVMNYVGRKAGYKQYNSLYLEKIAPLSQQLYDAHLFHPNDSLLNNSLIIQAFELAENCHFGQERKYTHSSYMIHLKEVAARLTLIPNITSEVIIAGILHDVVEKGNISLEYIQQKFGDTVYSYVYTLSDPIRKGSRSERIPQNFQHFISGPAETKNIKIIDIISNTKSIILCDASFSEDYMMHMQYMNQFFQNSQDVHKDLKVLLQVVMDIGDELLSLQQQFNIGKLDKKKTHNKTASNCKY